jgi:hypothetical protein
MLCPCPCPYPYPCPCFLFLIPASRPLPFCPLLPVPAGKSINLAEALPGRGFTSGVLGCPDGRVVCPQLSCKKPCVNGQCYQGRCICDMEYTGDDCSKNLVPGWS